MAEDIAVVFADAHLQKRAWAHRPIEGDAYHAFEQIVSYAIERELPLIGAGDLIDKRVNDAGPIVFLRDQLDRLEDHSPLYFIQGQHEMDDPPWFSVSSSAKHLHRKLREIRGLAVYGLDFQPVDRLRPELDEIPKEADVLIAHQVWSDWMGDIANPQGSFADVPVVRTTITGDLHEWKIANVGGKDGQDLRVYSLGSTCMQDISEPVAKSFAVLKSNGRLERVALTTRPSIQVSHLIVESDVTSLLEELPKLLEKADDESQGLPENLRMPLMRVTYAHHLSDVPRRIANVVAGRAHLFWRELAPEKPKVVPKVKEFSRGDALTLESVLPEHVDPEKDSALFALAQRSLAASEVEADLRRWFTEVTADEPVPSGGPGH